MARWYCKIGGKQYGPYAAEDLKRLVAEGRLLRNDQLREGQNGRWFAAEEMRDLFREAVRDDRDLPDDDDDDDQPRRRGKRRPSNYYQVLGANLWASDAQWKSILTVIMIILFVAPLAVTMVSVFIMLASMGRAGIGAAMLGLIWALVMPVAVVLAFFADALLFGLVCKIFRVRLDVRYHGVLDLFAFCYLIGLVPLLIRYFVGLGSHQVGLLLALLDPIVHAVVLGYFIAASWHFSAQRAVLLASVRFLYQMLFMLLYVGLIFFFYVNG